MANGGGLTPAKKGKGKKGGVSLFLFALFGLLIVATGVVSRRIFGIGQSQTIRAKERQRDALDADRVRLETEIRDASSRARLGPIAEKRLHMYVPADSQVIILKRDSRNKP
jgi:cell division protein FtsL